ncbi:uncharacterized protein LOC142582810 [Dermacentor variabilis]|uniref:uncharacterized protein LOC142582810 n=1 Tax=Dermacentor variabilis TaxID=34621 RepID=UPI003F5C8292
MGLILLILTVYYYIIVTDLMLLPPFDILPSISILDVLGFGTAGVRSGTVASWLQSLHQGGAITRRGWFASLQRWGMNGGVPTQCQRALKIVGCCLLLLARDPV